MVEVKLPLSAKQVEKLLKIPTDWGTETKEENIDALLYGQNRQEPDIKKHLKKHQTQKPAPSSSPSP